MDGLEELAKVLALAERRKETHRLEYYKPYPYQLRFHNAIGLGTDKPAVQRALQAANQVGKTFCAGMETAIHATGLYPAWWKGTRFHRPVDILVGSNTNETCRDICQKDLLGDPTDEKKFGTGTIPLEKIVKVTRKAGVPNALDTILVRHISGRNSIIKLRAYEQGFKKFMGIKFDIGWSDEEPPIEVWSQMLRATFSRRDAILYITYTPEEGMTQVVSQFMNDLKEGQALIGATWDDAQHMTAEMKQQRLAALPPHEREMRSKGVPLMGSGLIFPFMDDDLWVDDFEIPRHWPRITGIDFGWDHPFAAAQLVWNRDADVVYLISEYRESRATPPIHAATVNSWGGWIPVAWPHDGINSEKGTGVQLVNEYRDCHVNLLPQKATNPPPPGKVEGEGGNSREASILAMYERMESGQFKVFRSCRLFMEEKRMYHRKDGKIVDIADDLISAARYAHMMLRHARTMSVKPHSRYARAGLSNW